MSPTETVTQLQQLLSGLSSSDNAVREAHEQTFEKTWMSRPEILFPGLCMVITSDPNPATRSFAAILFRKIIGRNMSAGTGAKAIRLWESLDSATRKNCGETLISGWKNEKFKEVRNKISDAIAEVARVISIHEDWPQLLNLLWSVKPDTSSPDMIESSLRIVGSVPECLQNQDGSIIASYLAQFFNYSDAQARLSAVKTLNSVISVSADDKKQAFVGLVGVLPDLLTEMVKGGSDTEDSLTECIQAIVEIVASCPKLFKGQVLIKLCQVLMAIVESSGIELEAGTRSAALELLTTLVEAVPATVRKNKDLVENLITLLLKVVSTNLDDGDEWYKLTPEDEFEEEDLSLMAEAALDRVSVVLGGKTILSSLMTAIPGMVRSGEWKHRYAALRAIANIAEGCSDLLSDRLADLLSLVWPAFTDQHPRVQYAACHALGQLCTDFAGTLQEHFAQQCLNSLVGVLVSSAQPRVQAHAAAALINFAEGVDSAIIVPVLEGLFERLVALLSTNTLYLQEQVIATIAAFSSAAGPVFIKVSNMPTMR